MGLASDGLAGPDLTVALTSFFNLYLFHQLLLATFSLEILTFLRLQVDLFLLLDLVVRVVKVVSLQA